MNRNEVEKLVDAFPGQSIDFFGALRARVYDDKVRQPGGAARLLSRAGRSDARHARTPPFRPVVMVLAS